MMKSSTILKAVYFIIGAGMHLLFWKGRISSHDGMQCPCPPVCSVGLEWLTGGTCKKQLPLFALLCLLFYVLGVRSSFLCEHHPRAPFVPRSRTKFNRVIPEVHDSVSLAQVSSTSYASWPPGLGPEAGPCLRVARSTPRVASRPLAD